MFNVVIPINRSVIEKMWKYMVETDRPYWENVEIYGRNRQAI